MPETGNPLQAPKMPKPVINPPSWLKPILSQPTQPVAAPRIAAQANLAPGGTHNPDVMLRDAIQSATAPKQATDKLGAMMSLLSSLVRSS